MRMNALIWKELLVLRKDLHGLLVLFIMPAVFILIMSLAMRDSFSERHGIEIDYLLVDADGSRASESLREALDKVQGFRPVAAEGSEPAALERQVASDRYKFALVIPKGYERRFEEQADAPLLELLVAPTVTPQLQRLFEMVLTSTIGEIRLSQLMGAVSALAPEGSAAPEDGLGQLLRASPVTARFVYEGAAPEQRPTSVQQSVPAWLVFAMFFVVIPLSTAFIIERQQGSLLRLRIMNISSASLILGKIIPYYLINQVQMVLMILVGVFLVPRFGGDSLELGHSLFGLWLISSATSIAAIAFALLLTTLARTHTQATTLGGVSNIIFGALGGVMVPKFVMPPFMRDLADISPMSWGLEGFLDIFLRNSGWQAVLPEAGALLLFAAICLGLASFVFSRNQ